MRWTRVAAAAAVVAAAGCASRGPEGVLATEGPRMTELFRGPAAGGAERSGPVRKPCGRRWWRFGARAAVCGARPGPTGAGAEAYTRTALNELELLFPRLPNPDVLIYVYPHLATEERVPVPGYTTAVPLYARAEYALPGEMPGAAAAAEGAGPRGEGEEGAPGADAPASTAEEESEAARLAEDVEAALDAATGAAARAETGALRLEEVEAALRRQEESVADLQETVDVLETAAQDVAARAEADEAGKPGSGLAGLPPAGVPPGGGFAVRAVGAGECARVDVRRGSLRSNAERLAELCGYQLGAWPRERGDEEFFTDWVVTKGYEADVGGVDGLVDLIEAYGEVKGTVRERERVVDFTWEVP